VGTYFDDIGDSILRNVYKRTINPTVAEKNNYNTSYLAGISFNYSDLIPIYLVSES
jgi:hypothetical protein